MYNRFDSGLHPKENVGDIITAAKDHSTSIEDHILLLEKVITIFVWFNKKIYNNRKYLYSGL